MRCCSRLRWPCGKRDEALSALRTSGGLARWPLAGGVNNESIGCQLPQLGASSIAADVSDPASVGSALQKTLRIISAIDIFINNAGISGPNAKLWEYPVEDWKKIFAVNVEGTFYCCRAVVPLMRERNYGRIVNIASVAGKDGNPNASAYSASKAAVIALTKSLGKELADTSVRVNCVTPAAVRTPLFAQMTQAHIDYMLSKIPLGRLGEPQEVAALVAWLASEECSFSTGAVFDLSGGRSTY
ncbi:MAG: SDR family oxidoreductase [Alphaproteobacteria bacterium]|nr:MAG: SDR family oxidoreductase [Alphaproteobacteria bacterium]